jgi:hypothetical protein
MVLRCASERGRALRSYSSSVVAAGVGVVVCIGLYRGANGRVPRAAAEREHLGDDARIARNMSVMTGSCRGVVMRSHARASLSFVYSHTRPPHLDPLPSPHHRTSLIMGQSRSYHSTPSLPCMRLLQLIIPRARISSIAVYGRHGEAVKLCVDAMNFTFAPVLPVLLTDRLPRALYACACVCMQSTPTNWSD